MNHDQSSGVVRWSSWAAEGGEKLICPEANNLFSVSNVHFVRAKREVKEQEERLLRVFP